MAVDVIDNVASATVTTGGTTAPSAGTSEDWTVVEAQAFPAIGTDETEQYRVMDALDVGKKVASDGSNGGYEVIIVTKRNSDTSWTVTRGAENTTPYAHAANWTCELTVTAPGLNNAFLAPGTTISGGDASSFS